MGRQGKNTTGQAGLGKALVNSRKKVQGRHKEVQFVKEDERKLGCDLMGLKSVTEQSSYDEFISTAVLSQQMFNAEKVNIKFVSSTSSADVYEKSDFLSEEEKLLVSIPRRPKWNTNMSPEELDKLERESFLGWRRKMANLQNKQDITPFERNLEVWKQLWRVIERSNVVFQIIDARNPLLYRSQDLEAYVTEMRKDKGIIINKADHLSEHQRKLWSDYFSSINLNHAFYSAIAPVSIDETDVAHNSNNQSWQLLNRRELLSFMKSFRNSETGETYTSEKPFVVGLVGYPNVGKSSTINSLLSFKKTSVSATPGKTKHFQTLYLEPELMICDCPGLVMPAFGGSKAEMVLGGVLPIDQLTDYTESMELLTKRIPVKVLKRKYGVNLPENYSFRDLLNNYASLRGFMTVRGIPDSSRASRIMLKDYVNGKLLFCHEPPGIPRAEFGSIDGDTEDQDVEQSNDVETGSALGQGKSSEMRHLEKKFDSTFFVSSAPQAHIKGKQFIATGEGATSSQAKDSKPWKKHNNRNKKEKLRRVYRHLDV